VKTHNKPDDLWVVVNEKIYNASSVKDVEDFKK
jgi:cytochrome b involved in lipid metabolism